METKKCPVCRGRGYLRCECWPADCICGDDDPECEHCHGEGMIWEDEANGYYCDGEWIRKPVASP